MKKVLFFAIALFMFQFVSAQETEKVSDEKIYNYKELDVMPEFPGGIKEFYKFVGKNFHVPNASGLSGKVYATFVVEKDGRVANIKILRDIGSGTKDEAIRVLSMCPNWIPGEALGNKVRVLYAFPININGPR